MTTIMVAKFQIGDVVKHRIHPFRGVIFDVDPTFNNTEEWWQSIPEAMRPAKDQPYYHLLAENDDFGLLKLDAKNGYQSASRAAR